MNRKIIFGAVAAAAAAAVIFLAPGPSGKSQRNAAISSGQNPVPGPEAGPGTPPGPGALVKGRGLFLQKCMQCHGRGGKGTDKGPPLVHRFYEPNHHGDIAFYLAVERGVRQHHWRFGDMKPLPEVKRGEVALIIAYVRGIQKKAGIF